MKPKTRYLIAIMNLSCAVTIGAIDLKAQHLAGKVHMIEEELSSWTANGEAMQGKLFGKSTYIYDEKGKQTEWSYYNADGLLNSKRIYGYDEKGKLTEGTRYNPAGSLNAKTIYTYDEKENLIEQRIEYPSDGSLNRKTIFTYDENGTQTGGTTYCRGPRCFRGLVRFLFLWKFNQRHTFSRIVGGGKQSGVHRFPKYCDGFAG